MRVHLVDGTFELFRAHFSPRPGHLGPTGEDLKATVGVIGSLLSLLADRDEGVTHVAVAFDNPVRSFRNTLFEGYKTEAGVPLELLAQFDGVEQAVAALGVVVWSMDRWEADDALATGAARFRDVVSQVRILTPDKDLGQCVRGDRVVQVDRMRGKLIDETTLRETRGFGPASIPDMLALVGDTADGIPGIPGFGAKSTALVLGRYEHIEAIPTLARDWDVDVRGAKRLASNLAERRGDALLYRELATLIEDVPLAESLDDLKWRGAPRSVWEAWCRNVGRPEWSGRPSAFR
jgi:5'-3' exonuclease